MKSLVIGLGIGQLYKDVLINLGSTVYTVDQNPAKEADFTSVEAAFENNEQYDTVHIATPNFTHKQIADYVLVNNLAKNAIVFVDKPGFKNSLHWVNAYTYANQLYNKPRLMMVKNNQHRANIEKMKHDAFVSNNISLEWINENRVPNPGTWFTNKELAFGGVSRDLMPHLLSYLPKFFPYTYTNARIVRKRMLQNWKLSDLTGSDYGTIDPNGVYNVDDYCQIEMELGNKRIMLTADWRSTKDSAICATMGEYYYNLGLCPEQAYETMIETALINKDNDAYWKEQFEQDVWILSILDGLNG